MAVVVIALVVVQQSGSKSDTANVNADAPPSLVADLAAIPAASFQAAGTADYTPETAGLTPIAGQPDLSDGKPTLIYVGGEFCPYCAAQRWVLVATLDRFGSFTGLQTSRSAATDGNFATLSFQQASFASPYVAFDGKEIFDRARKTLQTLSVPAEASYNKFGTVGSVPYFSVNNAYTGTYQFNPDALGTSSAASIATQIHTGQTVLGRTILAASNILTAAVCSQTKEQPASVCSAQEVTAAAKTVLKIP